MIVTNEGVHRYTYDAENRVVSVDGRATAQYRYDHQNRRVCKIIGSSWTHYIWEGSQVIGEHDATTPYSTNPTYQVKCASALVKIGEKAVPKLKDQLLRTDPRFQVRVLAAQALGEIGGEAAKEALEAG